MVPAFQGAAGAEPGGAAGMAGGSMRRRWGLAEADEGGARCPAVQLMMRGMRPRTKARMDWHGAWLGRCSLTWVFISTTRTASLTKRSRKVSNWAVRQDERRGISVRRLHISQ